MSDGTNAGFMMEHISCDFCGSDRYRVRYRKPDTWLWRDLFEYPVVECLECGLVYVNPRPPFNQMGRFYPPGYHDARNTDIHRQRYQGQAEYIPQLDRERVLDIGCARGDWLSSLKARYPGIEAHGVDAFSESVAHEDIVFHKGALPECTLPDAYFDLVTAWAVLEHVHTPSAYFAEVSRIIKPGGRFVFLVPNAESLYGRMAFMEDVPRHLYHFSPRTIHAYASRFGFRVEIIVFDDRLWDGRGWGTFRHLFRRLARIDWRGLQELRYGLFGKASLRLGSLLDLLVFSAHWEAQLGRSGIMIVALNKT
ncbi:MULTISPECIES: class I SAM-dependent methyltransferase [unclassified Thiocapsa]|uniref:class I SAM-dependent methyltransferase n=1 Tax=unclassified Thiocapsa TaxID=2641286 RepID=UPI0035B10DD9